MWQYAKSRFYGVAIVLAAIGGSTSPAVTFATVEIQSNICGDFIAPTITSPASGLVTQDDSVVVTGEGEASLPVVIIKNGVAVAATTVSSGGGYSISVPLSVGENTISAREVNSCGTAKQSAEIQLQRNAVPQAPTDNMPVSPEPDGGVTVAPVVSAQAPSNALNQPIPGKGSAPGPRIPVILHPLPDATFTNSTVWVNGAAEPSSTVTIYVNGLSVARLRASSTGNFGATVELNNGRNSIQVEAEKDGKSALSEPTVVTYTPPASSQKGTSPFSVAAAIIAGLAIAAAVITSDVWVVKLIKARGGRS